MVFTKLILMTLMKIMTTPQSKWQQHRFTTIYSEAGSEAGPSHRMAANHCSRLKERFSSHKIRQPVVCRGSRAAALRQVEAGASSLPFCRFPGPNPRSSRRHRHPSRRSHHTSHVMRRSTGPIGTNRKPHHPLGRRKFLARRMHAQFD
jgi:hypothetical protein